MTAMSRIAGILAMLALLGPLAGCQSDPNPPPPPPPPVADADGDGVPDDTDACPDDPGPATNGGCPIPPDGDGDGVLDADDDCPDEAGPAANNGCPLPGPGDADGDGVLDDVDDCPDEAGPASNNGCPVPPDTDGDGIIDDEDDCPIVAGVPENNGCPLTLTRCPEARVVASADDLVPGPLARGTTGDIVLENNRIRVIIQKGGRNWYNISQFGGNIIDALPKNEAGNVAGEDHFEEFTLGTNIESMPNYQRVLVDDPGGEDMEGNCVAAVVRATGRDGEIGAQDDLMDFVNGSSAIRALTIQGAPLNFPPSADDVNLPLLFETFYSLEEGSNVVRIDTHLLNPTVDDVELYLVEYMNGAGEVELFQHGYGFGEAFATAPCDLCNFAAYAGHEGGSGVSYGLIQDGQDDTQEGSSSVSVSGVTVFLYGLDIVTVALTPEDQQASNPDSAPNFSVPAASGETPGELIVTRWFAVGDGTVSSIVDARNAIHELETGTVTGTVTDANGPVEGAEISMMSAGRDGFPSEHGPVLNYVNHFRTDADGRYGGSFPPGSYTLEINMPGRLAGTPATAGVDITADTETEQDFTLPVSSGIRVTVVDGEGAPVAAKVQLVGNALGPDADEPRNSDCFGTVQDGNCVGDNALGVNTGAFGDPGADPVQGGMALAEFAVLDGGSGAVTLGDTGVLLVEEGTYMLSVSHGPRYSHFTMENVEITEGDVTTVNAVLHEIMPTPNHVYGDFHVHSFDSPDSEVTNRERVANYVSEDVDFFTPSDHGMRVDFLPVVTDMGLASIVATAPSAEVTTFDYGHFNFWPVAIETDRACDDAALVFAGPCTDSGHSTDTRISRGATDWGGPAPYGMDFPSDGNYSRTPQEIFDDVELDPHVTGRDVVKQINHVDSHFGNAGGTGLGVDTGAVPPQSSVAPADRRLDPMETNLFSLDFDTLEVWIGTDDPEYQHVKLIEENLGDWFNLLNQGEAKVGISNSDTHSRRRTHMHTRNQISVPAALLEGGRADPPAITADPHGVGDSVRAGKTTMTNAPFLVVKATEGADVAGLEVTDAFGGQANPLSTPDGEIDVQVDVHSPAWAPFDQILVFVNGDTIRHTDDLGQPADLVRYRICGPDQEFNLDGDFTRNEVQAVPDEDSAVRLETTLNLTITGSEDYWFVVLVRGTTAESASMYPVVPNTAEIEDEPTQVYAQAISNPIYVDGDNDGTWTAPGVQTHSGAILPPDACDNGEMPAR